MLSRIAASHDECGRNSRSSTTSSPSNKLNSTTALTIAALTSPSLMLWQRWIPRHLKLSLDALLQGSRNYSLMVEIFTPPTQENSQAYSSFFLFLACLRSRLRARFALRISTTHRGTKGQGSGTPTAPVNPMTPITKAAANGTFSTV